MEILLWLVPAVAATLVAMAVAGWVGRERADSGQQAAGTDGPERLPGEIVGRPDEGVSAARPLAATGSDTGSGTESATGSDTAPARSTQRPPAPPTRRSA